jgi:DNA (cytosine-5)-methyltransferase 1
MWRDQPARTLMAHLGKDSYSHIHYDSRQARTISVREAARLHSFPDGFVFCGTMNPAFRQIGNAVPPLLAKAIATHMMKTLTQSDRGTANESKVSAEAVS